MTPARNVPIETWHNGFYGESFEFTADTAGTPVDLTGYAARMQVRRFGAQPGPALLTFPSVTSEIEGVRITSPANGAIELRIAKATLADAYEVLRGGVEAGGPIELVQDLVMTNPDGDDEVWFVGPFNINAGATL